LRIAARSDPNCALRSIDLLRHTMLSPCVLFFALLSLSL
jgi:hypothetical protein